MESAGYVSRCLLFEMCGIAMVKNDRLDKIYDELLNWTERYSFDIRFRQIIAGLPSAKNTRHELYDDILELYRGIFQGSINCHDIYTIRCLFTATLYMMKRYEDNIQLCSWIPYYFQLISYRLGGWSYFENKQDSSRSCILL